MRIPNERAVKALISLSGYASVCVVVQNPNRRKVRVEVQWNHDGDTPSICVAALADLKISGRHVIS